MEKFLHDISWLNDTHYHHGNKKVGYYNMSKREHTEPNQAFYCTQDSSTVGFKRWRKVAKRKFMLTQRWTELICIRQNKAAHLIRLEKAEYPRLKKGNKSNVYVEHWSEAIALTILQKKTISTIRILIYCRTYMKKL